MIILKKYFNNKVLVIKSNVYSDSRGFFSEFYNKDDFKKIGIHKEFKQDNFSLSKKKFTLRGIHLQEKPYSQAKLIRVVYGKIIDIIVDLRKKSDTFGMYKKITLSDKNSEMIYIPEGFGHGFLTLSKNTMVNYKVSNFYSPLSEITIHYKDSELNLNLGKYENIKFTVSKKDLKGISIYDYKKRKYKK